MVTWTNKREKKVSWGVWPRMEEKWTAMPLQQHFSAACIEKARKHLESKPRPALVRGAPRCLIYNQLKMLQNFESVFTAFFPLSACWHIRNYERRVWVITVVLLIYSCSMHYFLTFYGSLKIHRLPLEKPGKTRWKICTSCINGIPW